MSLLTEDSKEQNTEVSIIDLDSGETVNNITSASNMHCAAIDSVNKCIYLNDYTGTNIFYRYDLYWAAVYGLLIIDVDHSEYLKEGEINGYGDMRKYIYINMLTGELYYQFDIVFQRWPQYYT